MTTPKPISTSRVAGSMSIAPAKAFYLSTLLKLDHDAGLELVAISCLYRRTRYRPVRAEDATITRFGFQSLATALAVVEVLASISGHMFRRLVSTLRAGDC